MPECDTQLGESLNCAANPLPGHRSGRVMTNGAFVLNSPGTYVERHPSQIIIGNRPGPLLWCLTIVIWCITLSIGWLFWQHSRIIAALPSLVMGTPLILTLLNRQRWQLTPSMLQMRGSALGMSVQKDYPLGHLPRVRIIHRLSYDDRLPVSQVQICTAAGDWIGVAESGDYSSAAGVAEELVFCLGYRLCNGNELNEGPDCRGWPQ